MSTGLKANPDGSAAIQVGGTDVITLTSGGAATFVTSPTTVQAGTAAAPSITFSGDTNTGIFSPAADTIAFTEGGVESMRITSAGDVGIGTSSPGALLNTHIASASFTTIKISNSVTGNTTLDGFDLVCGTSGEAYVYNRENQPIIFGTNNTERMRINAGAPILCLAGGNTSATGTGIAFPATQSASSDANTLDDYEEGTFTPTLVSGFSVAPTSYSLQLGRYTKIGRVVYFEIDIDPNGATANATQIRFGGLPFTSAAAPYGCVVLGYNASFNTNAGDVYVVNNNSTEVHTNTNAGTPRDGNNAGVNINARIVFSGWYTT